MDTRTAHVLQRLPKPPRKPYIRPVPKQERKRPMTIAVGMYGTDGIVLGTDSQVTVPQYMKYSGQKIFTIEKSAQWTVGLAYSGDPERAQQIVDLMRPALLNAPNVTKATVKACLEDALTTARTSIINTSYESIDVICGFSQGEETLAMWSGKNGVVVERDEVVMLGLGDSALGRYLENLFDARVLLNTASAAVFAAYLVKQAVEFVDGCGGEIQLQVLQWGSSYHTKFRIAAVTEAVNQLHDTIKAAILYALNADMVDVDYPKDKSPQTTVIRKMDAVRKTVDAIYWKMT